MDYAFIWAGIIALSILAYALLDGFDLGVGILFPLLDSQGKDTAIHTISPVWDGNETWLVLGGGGLFATFPLAYSITLTAFYPLVIAMLLALVFRGVSLEYRERTQRWKRFWDTGFWLGSLVASFSQGIMVGAFIQGIEVAGRRYAGGWFDWLTPFTLTCGVSVVAVYALLGNAWLVMKTRALSDQVRRYLLPLIMTVFMAIVLVSSWVPFLDERLTERWFVWPNIIIFSPIPILVVILVFALLRAAQSGVDTSPFYLAELLLTVTYIGFGISTYPFIIPHDITIWEAAAPESSLKFLLVGTTIMLPIIATYTAHNYWVFRGKVHDGLGYHE